MVRSCFQFLLDSLVHLYLDNQLLTFTVIRSVFNYMLFICAVIVAMPVTFTHGDAPQDVLVVVGADIVLPCTAIAYPPPSFYWTKNGNPLNIDVSSRKFVCMQASGINGNQIFFVLLSIRNHSVNSAIQWYTIHQSNYAE